MSAEHEKIAKIRWDIGPAGNRRSHPFVPVFSGHRSLPDTGDVNILGKTAKPVPDMPGVIIVIAPDT